jgi:hypothetical protein
MICFTQNRCCYFFAISSVFFGLLSNAKDATADITEKMSIFGLLVGSKLPKNSPFCEDAKDMKPAQPYCIEEELSGKNSPVLLQSDAQAYIEAGAMPFSVKLNKDIYDTSVLFSGSINVWLSKDQAIQMIEMKVPLIASDKFSKIISDKFGPPTNQNATEWRNPQTGQVTSMTPNYLWSYKDVGVIYNSTEAGWLGAQTPIGTAYVFLTGFMQRASEIIKKNAPLPKKPM